MGFLILMVLAGLLLMTIIGFGTFWLLIQLGVIVQKAAEPPTTDTHNYSLNQGRDIGKGE